MMNKLATLAALVLATGCLEPSHPQDTRDLDSAPHLERFDGRMPMPMTREGSERADRKQDGDDINLCEQVVETEGACAVACEPEKLLAFIPDGTCALFICTLEDGSEYRTGGCDW